MSRPSNPKSKSRTKTFEKETELNELLDFVQESVESEKLCKIKSRYRIQIIKVEEDTRLKAY